MSRDRTDQQGTSSVVEVVPAEGGPKSGGERARPRGRPASSPSPRKPSPGRSRRGLYGIVGGVVAAAVVGVVAWRSSPRPATPPASTFVGGMQLSPEEVSLQRQAEQNPRDPEPWRKLAAMYLLNEQNFPAIWALQEALERAPGDVPTLLHLSEALELAQWYRPALATLSEVLRRDPNHLPARERIAALHLRLGEAKPALAAIEGAGKRLATWPEGLLELGRARQLQGDMQGAVGAYRRHLEAAPENADAWIRLGRALLEQGKMDDARRVLQKGRLQAVRDPRFPFYLGLSWMEEGQRQDPKTAADYFKEAFIVAPKHALPHHYMGMLLARQGRWKEAQAHFLEATKADPTYAEPQLWFARSLEKTGDKVQSKEQLGVYYFLRNDPYRAADAFRGMEKAAPNDVRGPRLVSLAYLNLGRNDWAIRETKAALQRHPNDTTLLERLATLYLLTHSRPPARRTCEQWLKIEPNAARARWLLGRAAQDDLKTADAIREYEAAVKADPSNAEYLVSLASALNDAGGPPNLRRAAELLQKAVQLAPNNAGYRHDLGMTLQQLGELDGARRQFLAALDRNPRHLLSFSGLSQLCARMRKPGHARLFAPMVRATQDRNRTERQLSRRLGQNPTRADAHFAMASFNVQWAAFPSAQSHLERALELHPDYPEAKAALKHVERVISIR